jgi:L-asparaginase II
MSGAVDLVELWRGGRLECVHQGHAVVADAAGGIVAAWGDPGVVVYPRSSSKMIQALPLIESGAAEAFGLGAEQLALACASHIGAAYHTDRVRAWIDALGLGDDDFRCGPHEPSDREARDGLIRAGETPCQYHNNCSGKHAGFLTINRHLRGGSEYVEADHPVQRAVREAFEQVTGEASPGYGIDGCSAPNFATTLAAMARAMAHFATAGQRGGVRAAAQARLVAAMTAHPELVSGERQACTGLMRGMGGRVAVKGGAEGFYVAILPDLGLGVALKIADGAGRASEAAIAQILIRLGALGAESPGARALVDHPLRNWRGIVVGELRAAEAMRGPPIGPARAT